MMLKIKFILRWGTIFIISIIYYISLAISTIRLDIVRQNEALVTNPVSLHEYYTAIDNIILSSDDTLTVSMCAFPIALLLSLLAFKRIR